MIFGLFVKCRVDENGETKGRIVNARFNDETIKADTTSEETQAQMCLQAIAHLQNDNFPNCRDATFEETRAFIDKTFTAKG